MSDLCRSQIWGELIINANASLMHYFFSINSCRWTALGECLCPRKLEGWGSDTPASSLECSYDQCQSETVIRSELVSDLCR